MPRGVTLRDVAQLAGVSPITVSRALAQPDKVATATLVRVEQAARTLGYVPNLAAGTLRSSRSGLVALVVPALSANFTHMVEAMTAALARQGYHALLAQTGYDPQREEDLIKALLGRRPDGMVLVGVNHTDAVRQQLRASAIPVVETWDTTPEPIDMLVAVSHEAISRDVCQYLARRGCRHLALVGGGDERSRRRYQVFAQTARTLGLAEPQAWFLPSPTDHGAGRQALRRLRSEAPQIDGVFCSSDALALGMLTEARVQGVLVPGELAVVGAGDLELAATFSPSLTSVRIDAEGLGRAVVDMIVARCAGQADPGQVRHFRFEIVARESA